MRHIEHGEDTDVKPSDVAWLGIGRVVSDLANEWSGRGDIIAVVGPEAGGGAPARFLPNNAELEINTLVAFGPHATPERVGDLSDPKRHYEFPRAIGLVAHEAFHAAYSLWDYRKAYDELGKDGFAAFEQLEESRIEAHGIRDVPRTRNFIRSAVIDINMSEEMETNNTEAAFATFALIGARVQSGVLDADEAAPVMDLVREFLGPDTVLHLETIVTRFQESRDISERYELAREWASAKQETAKSRGEETSEDLAAALKSAIQDALEDVMLRASIQLTDQEAEEAAQERVNESNQKAKDRKKNALMAEKVFGSASSAVTTGITGSHLVDARPPLPEERAAAVMIAKELEKAKYHDRIEIETNSYLPPGRLRTRTLVQGKAAASKGVRVRTEPWRRTVRKHAVDPTLTVGVMVDISGSMNRAMAPMATTAWVMSEAVRRVQGKVAMIYYGDSIFPTLRPGEHLDRVYTYAAMDSTEEFEQAFQALDGALGLLDGQGARLLVICSDGRYRGNQIDKAQYWLTRCASAGVAVLWLPYDTGSAVGMLTRSIPSHHISVVTATLSPAAAASEIGRAAATALTNASS